MDNTFFYMVLSAGCVAIGTLLYQLAAYTLAWLGAHGISSSFVLFGVTMIALACVFLMWAESVKHD